MAQRVKDLALQKLWHRLQLWLGLDPWPRELPYATGVAEKEKKHRTCTTSVTRATAMTMADQIPPCSMLLIKRNNSKRTHTQLSTYHVPTLN